MERQEAMSTLRQSLTPEQTANLRAILTMRQTLRLATVTGPDAFRAFYDDLGPDQRDHMRAILSDGQNHLANVALGLVQAAQEAATAEVKRVEDVPKTPPPSDPAEVDAAVWERIVDAIPRHIPKGDGGPWRITRPVFEAYGKATGSRMEYPGDGEGRDVALWLLRQNRVKTRSMAEALLAYFGGWGAVSEGAYSRWFPNVQSIIAEAVGPTKPAHDEPLSIPGLTVKLDKKRKPYSPWAAAAWGFGSFFMLALMASRKKGK